MKNWKYIVWAFFVLLGTACEEIALPATALIVQENKADVLYTSATLTIKLEPTAATIQAMNVYYSLSSNMSDSQKMAMKKVDESTYTAVLVNLKDGTTYYVQYEALNAFSSTKDKNTYDFRTRPKNGKPATPEYVDLGLSVKWATFNLGAGKPEDYGDYFAWGEIEPKDYFYWSTYKWCNGSDNTLTKYNTSSSFGTVDNKTMLELADDAAYINWGDGWRMPTTAEQDELFNNCTWKWTTQNGVNGYKVTSKSNGNSIFLPAAGYYDAASASSVLLHLGSVGLYWSSSLCTDYPSTAWLMDMDMFNSNEVALNVVDAYRFIGVPIRPVYSSTPPEEISETPVYVDLGLPSGIKWADRNVGATKPWEYGDHFAWGETSTKDNYSEETYSHATLKRGFIITKYKGSDYSILLAEDDAATAKWGGEWRMPTKEERDELYEYCNWEWTTKNGVEGYKVTSKQNGNSIFLPLAGSVDGDWTNTAYGFYWTSTVNTENTWNAYDINFTSSSVLMNDDVRYYGRSVRPVYGPRAAVMPVVATSAVTQITENSAVLGGNVTYDGNATVTERGVVYSTSPNPVITNLNNFIRPCGSGTGEFTYNATTLQANTTYYVRAYAVNEKGTAYGTQVSFTTKSSAVPQYVDLGLSVKWATFNVGASKPEEYGDYFAWGETEPKTSYSESNYSYTDNPTTLPLSADAARANWGGSWRMPTHAEQYELLNQCTWTWTLQNGVYGYKVTSTKSGYTNKSIFLPAAGCRYDSSLNLAGSLGHYWSSSLNTDNPSYAWYVSFVSSSVSRVDYIRSGGRSVRPVYGEPVVSIDIPTVTTIEATQITETTAVTGGYVTSDGGASVTERGVVYSTSRNPTTSSNKVKNGSGTGSFTCNLTGLQENTTYYVRAYAVNSKGTAYGTEVSFTTKSPSYSDPTGTENGYGYVDLGLSVKWATFNVGASKPEDYGDYFAWGETEPKTNYSESNNSYTDNPTTLPLSADAARANWGGSWRMPTDAEMTELREQCTWTWTNKNGVNGYKVTGTNGNSIFLPAAGCRYSISLSSAGSGGYYWSSSLNTDSPYYAYELYFFSVGVSRYYNYPRYYGHSVRPVCP